MKFFFRELHVTDVMQYPDGSLGHKLSKYTYQFANEYGHVYYGGGRTIWDALADALMRERD